MGRPVDALVGNVDDPVGELGVEVVQACKLLPPEEAFDILDPRFDLALGLGPIRTMRRRPEAIVSAEVPKDRIPFEARALKITTQHHRLEIIVDDLAGNAAQEGEAFFMGTQEGRHLLVNGGHGIHPPAVAQR